MTPHLDDPSTAAAPAPMPRRTFLAGGLGASALALAGCGFGTKGGTSTGSAPSTGSGKGTGKGTTLTFVTWSNGTETAAYQALADGFEKQTGTKVKLQVVPFDQALTTVDTGLRSKTPPDLFRVTYNDIGIYRRQKVLAELPGAATLKPGFLPAFWGAVTDDAGTYGIPQHTDTSMILCNDAAFKAAGLGAPPSTLDTAWTWEEFRAVMEKLAKVRPGKYALAANWQKAGAYRWLNFVDQAGGRLLTPDLTKATRGDAGIIEALTYTRGLFHDKLVPPSGSTKGQFASDQFANQTAAMAFVGDFLLADIQKTAKFAWTPTFLPRHKQASDDLGGNALAAIDGPRTEAAAAFLTYCAQAPQISAFCAATNVLPTRSDVDASSLDYPIAKKEMALYVQAATTIRGPLVDQVTVPAFAGVNIALRDRLETAFIGSRSTSDAKLADQLADDVDAALKK